MEPADDIPLLPTAIGHQEFEAQLGASRAQGRLHHAWLLTGPKGIGKSIMAKRAAAWLLSEQESNALFAEAPSGSDSGFHLDLDDPGANLVVKGAHPDLLLIAPDEEDNKSGQIKIKQVRALHPFMMHKPGRGGFRVAIIDSMDEINRSGANAMLKLLEEPPENTVIFLISSRPGQLPPTIRSRCRVVRMNGLAQPDCHAVLQAHWPEAESRQLDILTALAEGAPGRAIMLADSGSADCYQAVCALLGEERLDLAALATICGKWGQGAAAARNSRLGAIMLLERLLRQAALAASTSGGASSIDGSAAIICPFEAPVIAKLGQRHDAATLAEMQSAFTRDAAKAEGLYADFGHFLLRQITKFHEKTLP